MAPIAILIQSYSGQAHMWRHSDFFRFPSSESIDNTRCGDRQEVVSLRFSIPSLLLPFPEFIQKRPPKRKEHSSNDGTSVVDVPLLMVREIGRAALDLLVDLGFEDGAGVELLAPEKPVDEGAE